MGVGGPDPAKSYEVMIPGKTFLVGEYLALEGGPSVVANTHPSFRFRWTLEQADGGAARIEHGFHPESPAGKFLNRLNASRLLGTEKATIEFHDPHYGKGGLGASTAEFLGAWVFERWATEFEHADIRDMARPDSVTFWIAIDWLSKPDRALTLSPRRLVESRFGTVSPIRCGNSLGHFRSSR